MIISHSYFSRLMGIRGTPIPAEKEEVTDQACISVLGIAGAHQLLLDLSRCVLLHPTTFDYLKRCPALLYLDLSYTRILDLSPIRTCTLLRAFNGAGLKLTNDTGYDALRDLPQLELLILRGSNISNAGRLKTTSILRSLDISFTRIDSIEFLKDMKRLEELIMESLSLFTRGNAVANYLKVLQGLPSLRCINVIGTELAATAHQPALLSIHRDIHIESKTRHEIFFAAVAGNDIKKVEECLGAGIDINTRCDSWCEAIMAHHVEILLRASERFHEEDTVAKRGYQMIPFFNFHKDSKERPCAIHIALFFGYIEMTKILVHHGVSHSVPVYVNYPIKENSGGGTVAKGNQAQESNALTAATLKQNAGTAVDMGTLVETDNLISVLFELELYHEMAIREELKKCRFRMVKPPEMRNEGKGRFKMRNVAQRHCRYLDLALLPHGDVDDNGSMPGSVLGSFTNVGSIQNIGSVTIGATVGGDVGMVQGIAAAEAIAAMAVSSDEEMRTAKQGHGPGVAPGPRLGTDPTSEIDKHIPPITDALDTLLQGGNNNDEKDDDPALQDPDHKMEQEEYDENGKKKKKMKERDIIQGVVPLDDKTKRWRSHYLVQRLIGTGTPVVPTSQMLPVDGEQGQDQEKGIGRKGTSKGQGLGRKKNTPLVVIMGGRNFWGEGKRITRQMEFSKLMGHHDDETGAGGKDTDQPYMNRSMAMTSEQIAAALARDGWDHTRPATSPTPHRPTSPSALLQDDVYQATQRPYSPPYYNPYDNADPVDEEMSLPVTERLALFKRVLHKYFADDGRLPESEEEMMRNR